MRTNLWRWLLHKLQRRCRHELMLADIHEGCAREYRVKWCPDCGAYQIVCNGDEWELRKPRPHFHYRSRREAPAERKAEGYAAGVATQMEGDKSDER